MNVPSADSAGSVKRLWPIALLLIGLAWSLQAYAIWSPEYLPLLDLPNHMARHFLEASQWAGRDIGPFYAIEYRLVPNLGGDLVLPPLILALGAGAACKLFLTLAAFLNWLGPAWFIAQQGEYRKPAVVAALLMLPFAFTSQLYFGFINCYSGMGLAFLILVHFGSLQRQASPPILQSVLHAGLVALLFIWHLAPWTVYGTIMGCLLVADAWKRYRAGDAPLARILRQASLRALPAVPSLVLLLVYSLTSGGKGVNPEAGFDWGSWQHKVLGPASLFRGYQLGVDVIVTLLWMAGIILCFGVSLVRGWRWQPLHLCLAAMVVLYVVLPLRLGGTFDSDSRVLPAVLACGVGLLGSLPVQRIYAGAAVLSLALVLRFGSVSQTWNEYADEMARHAPAFQALEPHSRVLPVVLVPEPSKRYPETHFLSWAVLSKQNVLVPNLFAGRDQQPLRIAVPHGMLVDRQKAVVEITEAALQDGYDHIWIYNPARKTVRVPPTFECVFSATTLSVWRLRPQPQFAEVTAH